MTPGIAASTAFPCIGCASCRPRSTASELTFVRKLFENFPKIFKEDLVAFKLAIGSAGGSSCRRTSAAPAHCRAASPMTEIRPDYAGPPRMGFASKFTNLDRGNLIWNMSTITTISMTAIIRLPGYHRAALSWSEMPAWRAQSARDLRGMGSTPKPYTVEHYRRIIGPAAILPTLRVTDSASQVLDCCGFNRGGRPLLPLNKR